VDDPDSPPLVLFGRVVTMKGEGDVIADGAVYLRSGEIVAVRSAADPAPNGFANAPVLTTEGTIYPGLLDLHNHLVYNVATLWNVPRAFKNRDQWQRHTSYRENLTLPMGVLAQHPATVPPLVRYVETKALLGGTTSVQGMRSKFHGATKLFTGSVRNFEENLLHATERQVRLVVVAGFPRHGDAEALNRFGPAVAEGEDLLVGGRAKRLYLEHPKSTLKIGFDAARAKLEDYAGRLHELDAEIQAGAFTLSAAEEEDFSLLLDNDDYPPAEPGEIELLAAELTLPESIPIDPPTVVDDAEHFARLAAIAHRPAGSTLWPHSTPRSERISNRTDQLADRPVLHQHTRRLLLPNAAAVLPSAQVPRARVLSGRCPPGYLGPARFPRRWHEMDRIQPGRSSP